MNLPQNIPAPSLYSLSRAAERMLESTKDLLREKLRPTPAFNGKPYLDFSSTHPNHQQYETTLRTRWLALRGVLETMAEVSAEELKHLDARMGQVFILGADFHLASLAGKQRLAEKRNLRKVMADAHASQAERIGRTLKIGSEKTYTALRAGLKQVEGHLSCAIYTSHRKHYDELLAKLTAAGFDLRVAFPGERHPAHYSYRMADREEVFVYFQNRETYGLGHNFVDARPDLQNDGQINAFILKRATREANDIVGSFCDKLAGKIDDEKHETQRVTLVEVKTAIDIWSGNELTVQLSAPGVASGVVAVPKRSQVWNTKVIWNRSCLGNVFNQWPTRLVS